MENYLCPLSRRTFWHFRPRSPTGLLFVAVTWKDGESTCKSPIERTLARALSALTAYTSDIMLYSYFRCPHSQRQRLVCMVAGTRNHTDVEVLPLWKAVLCLDCEVISSSRDDECPACKGRSLVSLARMLGGSLLAHRAKRLQESDIGLFDITIAVALQQVHAKDLRTIVDRLTGVIAPQFARGRASFHMDVEPTVDRLNLQPLLRFSERDAA